MAHYERQTKAEVEQMTATPGDTCYIKDLNEKYELESNGNAIDGVNVIDAVRARPALKDDDLRWQIVTVAGGVVGGGGGSGSSTPGDNQFWVDSSRTADKPNRIFNTLNDVFTDGTDGIPSKDTTAQTWEVKYFNSDSTNITSGFIDNVVLTANHPLATASGNILISSSANGTPKICDCKITGDITFTGTSRLEMRQVQVGSLTTTPIFDNTGGGAVEMYDCLFINTDITYATDAGVVLSFWTNSTFLLGSLTLTPSWEMINCILFSVPITLSSGNSLKFKKSSVSDCGVTGTAAGNIRSELSFISGLDILTGNNITLTIESGMIRDSNFNHQPDSQCYFRACQMANLDFQAAYLPAASNITHFVGAIPTGGNSNNSSAPMGFGGGNISDFTPTGFCSYTPFVKIVTLTSAASATPVDIITEDQANPDASNKIFLTSVHGRVNGVTAWGTIDEIVIQKDTIELMSIPVANLTGNSLHVLDESTMKEETVDDIGDNQGIKILAKSAATPTNGTGSDFICRVTGVIEALL